MVTRGQIKVDVASELHADQPLSLVIESNKVDNSRPVNYASIKHEYAALRLAAKALNNRLVATLQKHEIETAARLLGIMRGKRIEFETEDEMSVLFDYTIHNLFHDGRNAVVRMLEDNPPPENSLEFRILRSMQKSHHTILRVEEASPGLGVRVFDTTMDRSILIVDKGFSMTATPETMLATRIYSVYEGWWVTTGAALPVTSESLERIWQEQKDHARRFEREPTDIEWATMVTRACLASGASQHIGYVDFKKIRSKERTPQLISSSRKIGRNDPCPCGSGKKYKMCCANSG